MLNEINLQGRFGRDPEVSEKMGKNGPFKIARFSIAVNDDFGDETDWFPCELIGKQAEVIGTFFHKGDMIIVNGRMKSFKPKNDPDHKAWRVKVERFWFCDHSKKDNEEPGDSKPIDSFDDIDEDVPF